MVAVGVRLMNAEMSHPVQCVPDRLGRSVDAVFVAVKVNGRDLLRKRVRGRPVQISLLDDNLRIHGTATSLGLRHHPLSRSWKQEPRWAEKNNSSNTGSSLYSHTRR